MASKAGCGGSSPRGTFENSPAIYCRVISQRQGVPEGRLNAPPTVTGSPGFKRPSGTAEVDSSPSDFRRGLNLLSGSCSKAQRQDAAFKNIGVKRSSASCAYARKRVEHLKGSFLFALRTRTTSCPGRLCTNNRFCTRSLSPAQKYA